MPGKYHLPKVDNGFQIQMASQLKNFFFAFMKTTKKTLLFIISPVIRQKTKLLLRKKKNPKQNPPQFSKLCSVRGLKIAWHNFCIFCFLYQKICSGLVTYWKKFFFEKSVLPTLTIFFFLNWQHCKKSSCLQALFCLRKNPNFLKIEWTHL